MPERTVLGPSIAAALRDGAGRLHGSGIVDPRREARMLWAAVAGDATTPGDVWIGRDRAPAPEVAARFRQAIELRAGGVPFAYAVGSTDFRTLQLSIDRRALIPRPETEGLVDLVLHAAGTRDAGCGMRGVAADIGTGCGCIALALAVEGNFERVIAVERSPEAAALARQNVARLHPAVPVEVRQGDLFAPLAGARYRAIVSNPPYLTETEYLALDLGEQLPDDRVLLHAVAGPHEGLVLFALPEQPAQLSRLLVDHTPSARRATRKRGRPNRSSCTVTRDQPQQCASERTVSARRSSISSATSPPGSSSAAAPASKARVASSPSAPLTKIGRAHV